jgi:hypothetical protein
MAKPGVEACLRSLGTVTSRHNSPTPPGDRLQVRTGSGAALSSSMSLTCLTCRWRADSSALRRSSRFPSCTCRWPECLKPPVRPAAGFSRRNQQPGRRPIRTESVRVGRDNGQLASRCGQLRPLATRRHARGWSCRSGVTPGGPGLLWSYGHATVIANVFEEIEARNRPRGTSAVLRLLYPF